MRPIKRSSPAVGTAGMSWRRSDLLGVTPSIIGVQKAVFEAKIVIYDNPQAVNLVLDDGVRRA